MDSLWFQDLFSREFLSSRCAVAFFFSFNPHPPTSPHHPIQTFQGLAYKSNHLASGSVLIVRGSCNILFVCFGLKKISFMSFVLLQQLWCHQIVLRKKKKLRKVTNNLDLEQKKSQTNQKTISKWLLPRRGRTLSRYFPAREIDPSLLSD